MEQRIGAGGMGAVYEAADLVLQRRVAVKVIREELVDSSGAIARSRIAAGFSHPNVVTVFDFGISDGERPFIVMELLHGRTLRNQLRAERRIEVEPALSILSAVCAGVDAAHQQGLIDRDLKPENLFLTRGGVKTLDFGLSKLVTPATHGSDPSTMTMQTAVGMIAGTPDYMSPEQLDGTVIVPSINCDIWALGVISYEMLTGTRPFAGIDVIDSNCDPARYFLARIGTYAGCAGGSIEFLRECVFITPRTPSRQHYDASGKFERRFRPTCPAEPECTTAHQLAGCQTDRAPRGKGLRFGLPSPHRGCSRSKQPSQPAHYPANEEHRNDYGNRSNHDPNHGLHGHQQGANHRHPISSEAQKHVRKRLRGRVRGQPCRRFSTMRTQGDAASEQKGQKLNARVEMRKCRRSKDGTRRHGDKSVNDVPNRVDGRDLICYELHDKQRSGDHKYPRMTQIAHVAWKRHKPETLQQPEAEHGRVKVDAGEPGRAHSVSESRQVHQIYSITSRHDPRHHRRPVSVGADLVPEALSRYTYRNGAAVVKVQSI
jgi:serine/threonine protein kinase